MDTQNSPIVDDGPGKFDAVTKKEVLRTSSPIAIPDGGGLYRYSKLVCSCTTTD